MIIDGLSDAFLTRRAKEMLASEREEMAWVKMAPTVLVIEDGADRSRWWSFAGDRYNAAIAERLRQPGLRVSSDGLSVTMNRGTGAEALASAVVATLDSARAAVTADADRADGMIEQSVSALKFAEAVPGGLLARLSQRRFYPETEAQVMAKAEIGVRLVQ